MTRKTTMKIFHVLGAAASAVVFFMVESPVATMCSAVAFLDFAILAILSSDETDLHF
jgi:hypothetical protein